MRLARYSSRRWLLAAALAAATARTPQVAAQDALASAATVRPGLSVSGHLDREIAEAGDIVRFWVSFTNETTEPITDLVVALSHPGFDQAGNCWQEHAPVCAPDGTRPPAILAPGERVILTAALRAGRSMGKVAPTAFYRWRAGAGPLRQGVTTIGSVELAGSWETVLRFVEVLIWPVVLLGLAGLFKWTEQQRAEIQQTWTQMLHKSHENAERFYMPISSQIMRLRKDLERLEKATALCEATTVDDAERERRLSPLHCALFEDLLVLVRRQREMAARIGGWYFKSRSGEDLVAEVWRCFLLTAHERLERPLLERVLDGLAAKDSPAQVAQKLASTLADDGSKLSASCRTWLSSGDFRQVFCLLNLLEVLLDFEMNRCYERWYGRPEAFPEEKFEATAVEFRRWAERLPAKEAEQRQRAKDIASLLAQYPREARRHRNPFARWLDWVDQQAGT